MLAVWLEDMNKKDVPISQDIICAKAISLYEERQASGFKAAKDRLTLLLGGNATGDFKLKPLLVYQSETLCAMRGTDKDSLPVVWRSNRKAWVTREVKLSCMNGVWRKPLA
ncbi:unnamed protein product [Euphydryas editha]|uniref:DDE-1 domain-containing protein n=1 Tax=Euphydryas editha TaxID=104508 RepID=A0AAU9VAB3_EUPED|nr:unnamed protein product [Euphydryas editha]